MDQHIRDVEVEMVDPRDGNVVFTEQVLLFHLTAITAVRQNTFIQVDFGGGVVKTAAVREKQTVSPSNVTGPTLFASYGLGCNLSLKFDHVYETEGIFTPLVTLFNNISSVSIRFRQPIYALHEVKGVQIQSSLFAPLGRPVPMNLSHASQSTNVTVSWKVFDHLQRIIYMDTVSSLETEIIFPSIGKYEITSTVSNSLSSHSASSFIIIQEPVSGLEISCNQGPYIEVKQEIVCRAEVKAGNGVAFKWNFEKGRETVGIAFSNGTSIAKHRFLNPNIYKINVTAFNNVSQVKGQLKNDIYVQFPVDCLNIVTSAPPLPGKAVKIVATASRGTSLTFDLQIAHKKRYAPHHVEVSGHTTMFSVDWVFDDPATYSVTVQAYNHLSNVSRTIEVDVQELPPDFQIIVLPTPFRVFPKIALKTSKGELLYRPDLLFHFHFAGGETRTKQAPAITLDLRGSGPRAANHSTDTKDSYNIDRPGQFQINVIVSNKVGQKSKTFILPGEESQERRRNRKRKRSKTSLWHSTFVRSDEFVRFYLGDTPKDVSALHIDYGDGMRENVSCVNDSCAWGRKFQVPGVFALDISLYGRRPTRKDHALRSVLVVEEPIKGLRLQGPTAVGIECDQDWIVTLESGSNLVFVWSLDNEPERPTTSNKYVAGFSRPGFHTLHVNVSNDIGFTQASLNFTVKHPIVNVTVSILPSPLNTPTNVYLYIEGGREFTIRCWYGDDHSKVFSSESVVLEETGENELGPASFSYNSIPKYKVNLKHVYQAPGEYNVTVDVANGVSSVRQSGIAVVEQAIGTIHVYTENSGLMSIHDELVIQAVVSSGRNLEFSWNFSDNNPSMIESEGSTSKVAHSFLKPGKYEVSVTVSNHLQKDGIKMALPFQVHVVKPITNATVILVKRSGQNAGALTILQNGQRVGQDVEFKASAYGSSVKFLFDFGDGQSASVNGSMIDDYTEVAYVKHVYTQRGVFAVKMTASNPLGSLNATMQEPIYVQVPPTGLELKTPKDCLPFGEVVHLSASLQAGDNVTYTWKLDDQTELIDAGPYITHQYRKTGLQNVQVKASNKVGEEGTFIRIKIQEKIMGVNLIVEDTIIEAGKLVNFKAVVHPPSAYEEVGYEWMLGRHDYTTTHVSYLEHNFRRSGWHNIQVKAVNCLSSAISVAVPVHVVAQLKGLEISALGDIVVQSPVQLRAKHWEGDSLTFTWDFGDGSTINATKDQIVSHTYTKIGEYMVQLWAQNPVSKEAVSKRIFILDRPCDPPSITIRSKNAVEFLHSGPVRIESTVAVNCSTSTHVKFKWQVLDASNRRSVNIMVPWASDKKSDKHLLGPVFLLPARTLENGRYIVRLEVEMNGTQIRVYSDAEIKLTVLPTPLLSIIRGGIYRHAGQHSHVHLDGRGSGYLDDSSVEIRYQWNCSPLSAYGKYCFESPAQTPALNESQLIFPSNWLTMNFAEFAFNLTVSKISNAIGVKETSTLPAVSSQVIRLQPQDRTFDLMLECPQCWRNLVNSDKKVSLRTHCPNCPREFLTYTWEIFLLEGKSKYDFIPTSAINCVNADGSSYLQLKHGVDAVTTSTPKPLPIAAVDSVRAPKTKASPINQTDTSVKEKESQEWSLPNRRMQSLSGADTGPVYELSEGESQGPRREHKFPQTEVMEGEPGSSGSSAGRHAAGGVASVYKEPKEGAGGGRHVPMGKGTMGPDPKEETRPSLCLPEEPDCLQHKAPPSPPPPHLVSQDRLPFLLTSEQTLTGLDQPSLVIKPGVLWQGRSYFVQVTAKAQDGSTGLAMIYFEVNKSPSKGSCNIRPDHGEHLETEFRVFCKEWKDEHLPLHYEVSYSLDGPDSYEDSAIIYQGLAHEIRFKLPAGLHRNRYLVQLHIAVLDRLGSKTLICRLPIKVHPTNHSAENRTAATRTDEFLKNATELLELASTSTYDGFSHDLFRPLTQLATNLNTYSGHDIHEQSRKAIRALTRSTILETLIYIPLRDEFELIQALRCLVATTNDTSELDGKTLLSARELLQEISIEARDLFTEGMVNGWSRGLNSQILHLAVRAVSNLLVALATNHDLFSESNQQQRLYKSITSDQLRVINSLIQLEMQYHSIGEEPLALQDNFISLNATHYSLLNLSPLAINGLLFQLPSSLEPLLSQKCKEGSCPSSEISIAKNPAVYSYRHNSQCFQARAMSFPTNPFAMITSGTDLVQSELASLHIYNCFGDNEVTVKKLPSEDMIQVVIPRNVSSPSIPTSHLLYKSTMNVHHLNGSSSHSERNEEGMELLDRYLHIHIQLEPLRTGHAFPILVIISTHPPPLNLKQHIFKERYDGSREDIKILLLPESVDDYFNGQHYYIGLVEASFNSGRRRSDEVEDRNYIMNIWWSSCLYWNHTEDRWRSNGCEALESSSVDALHCRCSHLTTFGGYFDLVPNELSLIDVDEFFSLHENPVVVILVAVVLLIYMLLAIRLRQADAHDARKGNCVYLQDNTVSHHQKYEVVMETGFTRDAGTTSKISIILHGEEGMSETRELISDDNRPMFERNSRDRFIVTLPNGLGKIFKIQLWHNNSGSSPGWYLRQVVVRDLNAGQAFYFLCQKWLAVDKDDGKVEREFTAVEGNNMSFGMIFWCKGSQYLSDFHTWMSIWTCPPYSRFTRVQRLTVCFTLLMTYMCLNAMWFKQTPGKIRGEFGLLDLSWHNIFVGFICCTNVIPLNLMLSFLFRRSRVHFPDYEQEKMLLNGKPVGEAASEGEDEPPQASVTYSILDQSILNWQNIQDWAQKQWLKRQQSVRSSANSVKTTQTSPQLSAPSTTPLVQQTLLAEDDTDQGSSGFEDATSQATAERHRVKTTSDISSDGKKSRNVEQQHVLNASRRIFLPFWCRYIAWILCFLISCTCGAVTILYGFRFGHAKSVMWLQSVYFSFTICLFISQPILILLCVLYTAMSHRHNPAIFDHYDDGFYGERIHTAALQKQHSSFNEEEEELQRGVAERSRSRYLRFAGPPQEKHLKSSRKKLIRQKRAVLLLRDSVWFIVLFTLLCIMAFGKDTQAPCQMNLSLKHAFVEKQVNNTSFLTLKSPTDWYKWSQEILLHTLYKQTSLRDDLDQMADHLGYLIGYVQIRCKQQKPEAYYGGRFLKLDDLTTQGSGTAGKTWAFRRAENMNPGLWGQAGWYDNTGSVVLLNHSREEARRQLEALNAQNWINRETQAVFVELTLYNAATNLFSSITLVLEVTPASNVLTSAHILSSYLFRYITPWDNFVLACELSYIILALWMVFHESRQMVKLGKMYFYHFWNYIELLMAVISLIYVGFYIFRFVLVSEAVEFMRSTFYEEFINLHFVLQWDEFLRNLTALLVFCVIVKLLKALRYHQVFWKLQTVYRRCKQEILLAAVLYGGLIMAFSSLSTGLFGSVVYNMRSLWSSLLTMSALSVRAVDWPNEWNSVSNQSPWLDLVLLFSFTFCHGFVLTYIFIVLAHRIKKTKHCRVLAMPWSQLFAFYWDMILKWSGVRPEAIYESSDNTLPPEFTMAEILYLVEELLFRMNALLGTASLPDKRHSFTDSDATPNEGDDGISSGGSEEQAILVTTTAVAAEGARLEQRVQKIEDKLCSNEPYLAQLLKLDSIGTDILSEEKEKELRSHLEFEIFRQLQMQRQESTVFDVSNQPMINCTMQEHQGHLNLPANKTSGPNSPGLGNISDDLAAAYDGGHGRLLQHPITTRAKDDSLPSSKNSPESSSSGQESPHDTRNVQDLQAAKMRPVILLPPKRSQSMKVPGKQAGRNNLSEAVKTQKQWLDLSITSDINRELKQRPNYLKQGTSAQKYPKITGKKDYQASPAGHDKKFKGEFGFKHDFTFGKRPAIGKETSSENSKLKEQKSHKQDHSLGASLMAPAPNPSSGNISPQSSESEHGHKRTDSSSGQSGHERNDTPKPPNKRPDLPPKPTFAHLDSGRTYTGWTPKPRQFTFLPDLMTPLGAESSSGSEQEATLSSKRASQGRRNLRKTKSRGKGKGNEGGITSPMVLAADFASSGQSGGSDFDIIIHPVPSGIDPDDNLVPEQYLH